jgi:hypothetical protein
LRAERFDAILDGSLRFFRAIRTCRRFRYRSTRDVVVGHSYMGLATECHGSDGMRSAQLLPRRSLALAWLEFRPRLPSTRFFPLSLLGLPDSWPNRCEVVSGSLISRRRIYAFAEDSFLALFSASDGGFNTAFGCFDRRRWQTAAHPLVHRRWWPPSTNSLARRRRRPSTPNSLDWNCVLGGFRDGRGKMRRHFSPDSC